MNLNEYEFNTEVLNETNPENNEFEYSEQEMAAELMNLNNEQEFEYFLDDIWQGIAGVYNSPQAQIVKRNFIAGAKQFGRKMAPVLGKSIGSFGGQRGAGYGRQIGDALGGFLFENEGEAINYIRVIRNAANYLLSALQSGTNLPPRQLVTQAITTAARPYYLKRRTANFPVNKYQLRGRWIRKGNQLILLNVR